MAFSGSIYGVDDLFMRSEAGQPAAKKIVIFRALQLGDMFNAITAAVTSHMCAPGIDLAGRTTLGGLGALLSKARLVINNDTRISHVTAAVKTPSLILFSVPDMDRWAPNVAETVIPEIMVLPMRESSWP